MPATPNRTPEIAPPTWLSAAEKREFLRLIQARNDAGKPVSASEIDMISDLIQARNRLVDLSRAYRRAAKRSRASGHVGICQKDMLAVARQIDAATAKAHRLAERLGL